MSNAAQARAQRAEAVAKRRRDEALCVWDFLTWGDTGKEPHAAFCIRPAGLVCSRDYHPGPMPEDEKLYEGTGIGSLFGLNGTERDPHAWQLAGWNITRRKDTA